MADEYADEGRTFEPISTLTPGELGRGMLRRARTQGEGIARQIAQNYQDIAHLGREAVSPFFPRPSTGRAPWEQRPAEMTESPFAQASSDPGVRVGAQVFDPANLVGAGSGGVLRNALKQAATSRALRETAPVAAAAAPVVERELPRLPWNRQAQAGNISPGYAAGLAGAGLGAYGLSRLLRGGEKTEDDPAARTTANAFRQQQEAMDAVNAELRRQQGK